MWFWECSFKILLVPKFDYFRNVLELNILMDYYQKLSEFTVNLIMYLMQYIHIVYPFALDINTIAHFFQQIMTYCLSLFVLLLYCSLKSSIISDGLGWLSSDTFFIYHDTLRLSFWADGIKFLLWF